MSLALTKKSLCLLEHTGMKSKNTNLQTIKKKRNIKVKKPSLNNNEKKINQLFMLSNSNMKEEIGERVRSNQ